MARIEFLLGIAILSLLPSCGKGKVDTEVKGWKVFYDGTPIPITSLLPDLKGQNITSEGGVYSLVIPFPDHRYSYTPSRIWLEPQDTTFTAQVDGFTSTPPFDNPISVHFHSRGNLSFHGLHQGDDIETLGYGSVSGTLTLHISYPESLPFDKIRLAANSQFSLPPFIHVENENCPDVVIHGDSGGSSIRTTKEIDIPRNGYDFTLECTNLSATDMTGLHLPPMSGNFTSGGTVILSPEDLTDPNDVGWVPSLNISLSTSIIEFTRVSAALNRPFEDEFVSVKVPFPKLSEEKLNNFSLAQAKTQVKTDDPSLRFTGKFSAQTGAEIMETDPFYFSDYPITYFFSQPLGSVEYTSHFDLSGYKCISLNGLNDLVKTVPDSIGSRLQVTYFPDSFNPGQEYYSDFSTTVYIPLLYAGTDWGKTIRTENITIPANDLKDAVPGTNIIIVGWVMNRQPFELKAVPVILDADGVSHRFEKSAVVAEGSRYFTSASGQKEFTIIWTAEETNRPISIYLEMTLGTGSYEIMAPDQDILYGIKGISKEVEIKR